MYQTIYNIPFSSVDNIPMLVEIQEEGYTGEATELKGGEPPFVVSLDDDDFLYAPTRFSTAKLKLVCSDYLQELYSTGYQQYRVNLIRNGIVAWTGFIKPEVYTQDYSSTVFELDIECVSAMSVLENLDYKIAGERHAFIPLFDLIKKCVNESKGIYNHVYVPFVYSESADTYNSGTSCLSALKISEQNFFDEDDEPMTLKEVLEETCKFLGWTCVDYCGDLYFVDFDHTGGYFCYSDGFSTCKTAYINQKTVQDTGFAGSGHTLDILGGYNKASVRVSNYNVGEIIPEDDYDKMKQLHAETLAEGNTACRRIFLHPDKIEMRQYILPPTGKAQQIDSLGEYRGEEVKDLLGAIPIKFCTYEVKDNKPSINEYNFTKAIQIRQGNKKGDRSYHVNNDYVFMAIAKKPSTYGAGAFGISGKMKFFVQSPDLPPLKKDALRLRRRLKVSLRIGDRYYHKDSDLWLSDEATFYLDYEDEFPDDAYLEIKNTKTLNDAYEGLSGTIIRTDGIMHGDLEINIYGAESKVSAEEGNAYGFILKDFRIEYKELDGTIVDDSDRIYSNVVNDRYVNELDEIEFKISSYNSDGACYSKVLLGDKLLANNLYCSVIGETGRPEEFLIKRVVNQYRATKIKLTQVLKYDVDLLPFTALYDNYMVNKKFALTGGEIDYKNESFTVKMIENDSY